ncbi:MAG: hypothetical protein ACI9TA_002702, partial [Reinekea sp.]
FKQFGIEVFCRQSSHNYFSLSYYHDIDMMQIAARTTFFKVQSGFTPSQHLDSNLIVIVANYR